MENVVPSDAYPLQEHVLEVLRSLGDASGLGVIVIEVDGRIQFLNEHAARWIGWDEAQPSEMIQELQPGLFQLCSSDSTDKASVSNHFDHFNFSLRRRGLSEAINCAVLKIPLPAYATPQQSPPVLLLCWFSEHNQSSEALSVDAMTRSLISKAPIGILSLNHEWECEFANAEAAQLTNFSEEELLGRGWAKLFQSRDDVLQKMISNLLASGFAQTEFEVVVGRRGHQVLQCDVRGSVDQSGRLEHAVCALIDVTDRVQRQQEIHKLANYDAVTGLHNRLAMKHQLERYLTLAKRLRQKVQVLFIDLDGFKNINDLYGHALGDQLLVQVAQRLQRQVRQNDLVARFGGDEFVIIMPGEIPDEVVDNIADKINRVLRHPYVVGEVTLHLSASIGISSFQGDGQSEYAATDKLLDEVLKQADLAMYAAKHQGKNQYRRFNVDQGEEITLAYSVGQHLPQALQDGHIFFHYQPILDAQSKRAIGVEALMRWEHEQLGWINPEIMISVAEANGLIIELQEYMIEHTIRDFEALLERLPEAQRDLRLSVNICAIQLFDFKYTESIAERFKRSRFGVERVTLELTESTLIDERPEVSSNIDYLKEQGFLVAMDDFGTGYSSLSYLTRFPIDIVKLDKSFIRSFSENDQQRSLVEGCVHLCHSLDKKVVAEGVETTQEFEQLSAFSVDYTQGYMHSRPLNVNALYEWFQKH